MTALASALYHGSVMHRRLRPRRHQLRYRVFSLLLDLDELPALHRSVRLFSHNRFNLFSFHDRDHGAGDGRPLRDWIEGHLRSADPSLCGGPIRVLCYPRILGYVFNPLTVYFCHDASGRLSAILYEVSNTFSERHTYLFPVPEGANGPIRQSCRKEFYVSPFISVDGRYDFTVVPPGDDLAVVIQESDDEGRLLDASFVGQREALTGSALLRAFVRYPLMTLKVIVAIHWEALKLWRKGVPLHDRPAPPPNAVTAVTHRTM